MIRQPGEIERIIEQTAKFTAEKIYAKMRSDNAKEQDSLFDKRLYNTKLDYSKSMLKMLCLSLHGWMRLSYLLLR